jgi:hypothetical protein
LQVYLKLTSIMWQQFQGVNLRKFWWEGQMMAKINMPFVLSINKTLPHVMITFLKPKLKEFVVHNFEAKWQDNMFKLCL